MHTRGMTYEEGVRFFEEQAYMTRTNAEREARRGTSDPTGGARAHVRRGRGEPRGRRDGALSGPAGGPRARDSRRAGVDGGAP